MGNIDTNTGIWTVNTGPSSTIAHAPTLHKFDEPLCNALLEFLEETTTIVDFGCGNADYTKRFLAAGKKVDAFDGNPNTPEMTGGIAKVLDLSQDFDLGKKYECVMSLEVGEHIPPQKEQTFINNLGKHSAQCIIVSWALPGQGGDGHFNEQPNDYIKKQFADRGYKSWDEAEQYLRNSATLWWFKKTIMVFVK
jgi:hypothetical protein